MTLKRGHASHQPDTQDPLSRPDRYGSIGRLQDQPGVDLDPGFGNVAGRPLTDKRERPWWGQAPHPQVDLLGQQVVTLPAEQPQRGWVRRRVVLELPMSLQVGGLTVIGEPDPNAQVVVGQLPAGSSSSMSNMPKMPKKLCSLRMIWCRRRCRVQAKPVG